MKLDSTVSKEKTLSRLGHC